MIIVHTNTETCQKIALTEKNAGHTLAQVLFLAGYWSNVPLCAGMGKCGLCKVRFHSPAPQPKAEEIKRFSLQELEQGWRLACLHPPQSCEIDIPAAPQFIKKHKNFLESKEPLALAIDLGTTSIHWQATAQGVIVAEGNALNPQIGLGSEIMARLAFAATQNGAEILHSLILTHIKKIITSLNAPVESLAISGNPTVIALLLKLPTKTLAAAPYALPHKCGKIFQLDKTLPPAYIPPLFAPFVGSDISAGLCALHFAPTKPKLPFILADLGTNGEFILETKEQRFMTSVPMGPALEGAGLSSGLVAAPRVITGFSLSQTKLLPIFGAGSPQAGQMPLGMTGTAALSLCALLCSLGLLEAKGQFTSGKTPLAQKIAQNFTNHKGEPAFAVDLEAKILLTASDVEEVLKLKAAFNFALSTLCKASKISLNDISIYLAGSLGKHVEHDDLERLGFIPSSIGTGIKSIGNTSLNGTSLLLTSPKAKKWLEEQPVPKLLDMTAYPNFTSQYLQRMVFSYVA